MRLTEKKENGFYELKKGQEIYGEENGIRLVQIVGEYEDIEEELGISLVTLFKALNRCYTEDSHKGTAMIINHEEIGIKYQINDYSWNSKICKIKDYGKTWALTKEELEDEKEI